MKKRTSIIVFALLFTITILILGYITFGFWTALIFTSGFLTGYILWLFNQNEVSFESIKIPFWSAFILFLIHRIEEKVFGFFALLSDITGVETPEIFSVPIILLILISVGAWLLIPILVKRGNLFGYYLAWTFFAAMGIKELAHFIFPFFTDESYGYFPGMASVVVLAPIAWWGMFRLSRKSSYKENT